jgi:hypothetical protein
LNGPKYYIDYCFIPDEWTNSILNVAVGDFEDWVGRGLSDHVPLVVDIDEIKITLQSNHQRPVTGDIWDLSAE